jgi:phosphotransferase system HPr (HPr) family protein
MTAVRLTIRNPSGLHARPAATFVKAVARFRSAVTVRNTARDTPPVNAKSIISVLTLGVSVGGEIEVSAEGDDADEAIAGIREAVDGGLGETVEGGGSR